MGGNVGVDIKEIGWEVVGWIHLSQGSVPVTTVMNLQD
jgi:hypothetical protein